METNSLFEWSNNLAMLGWILLLIAPEWRFTKKVVLYILIPILLSILYLYLIVTHFEKMQEGGFGSIAELQILFANPDLVLLGWVHYLAFDLFIGTWEYQDSKKHGIHRLVLLPCQVLTFLAGPVGLLLYLAIRAMKTKRMLHDNF